MGGVVGLVVPEGGGSGGSVGEDDDDDDEEASGQLNVADFMVNSVNYIFARTKLFVNGAFFCAMLGVLLAVLQREILWAYPGSHAGIDCLRFCSC